MIRNQQKTSALAVVPGLRLNFNPYAQTIGSARVLRNWIPESDRLQRMSDPSEYTQIADTASGALAWKYVNFRYQRAGATESQLIIFRDDGKVYRRQSSYEQEIFPASTSFSVLNTIPFVGVLSNRMFFSDGTNSFVYDGRTVQTWGIARTTTAPTVSAQGGGSLTAATGLKAAITWVVQDEAGNRVHESSRTDKSGFQVLSSEDLRIDISSLTAPSRATHWSGYVSELDNSEILRRTNTTALATTTFDVSALPAATSPRAPIKNDPPPPSTVGAVAKNRLFLRDETVPNRLWFSALGEVKGLLNGAPDESFPGRNNSSTDSISDLSNSIDFPDREIRLIIEHQNLIFVFTERRGFVLMGQLELLDNRAPRSLVNLEQFQEGAIDPRGAVSTPFGLVWFTPGKQVLLWAGGNEVINIGEALDKYLSRATNPTTADDDEPRVQCSMLWWDGGYRGRQWLVMTIFANLGSPYFSNLSPTHSSVTPHLFIYDFSRPSVRPDREPDPGSWFEIFQGVHLAGIHTELDGTQFLVSGKTNGQAYDIRDTNPFILLGSASDDYVSNIGTKYLGSRITLPACQCRTGLIAPGGDSWVVGQYISIVDGDSLGPDPNDDQNDSAQEIRVSYAIDDEDPDRQPTTTSLTSGATGSAEIASGEKRIWLRPQSTGNTNIGGALGKSFVFDIRTPGTDETRTVSNNVMSTHEAIYKFAFNWKPLKGEAQ